MRGQEFDYDGEAPEPTDEAFRKLDQLLREKDMAAAVVDDLESELKRAQARLRDIEEEQLPQAMRDMGVTEIRTAAGRRAVLRERLHASLPKRDRTRLARGITWLQNNGQSAIIKRKIIALVDHGDEVRAAKLVRDLRDEGLRADQEVSVNHQTLSAVLREMDEAGRFFTDEECALLGIYRKSTVEVK